MEGTSHPQWTDRVQGVHSRLLPSTVDRSGPGSTVDAKRAAPREKAGSCSALSTYPSCCPSLHRQSVLDDSSFSVGMAFTPTLAHKSRIMAQRSQVLGAYGCTSSLPVSRSWCSVRLIMMLSRNMSGGDSGVLHEERPGVANDLLVYHGHRWSWLLCVVDPALECAVIDSGSPGFRGCVHGDCEGSVSRVAKLVAVVMDPIKVMIVALVAFHMPVRRCSFDDQMQLFACGDGEHGDGACSFEGLAYAGSGFADLALVSAFGAHDQQHP